MSTETSVDRSVNWMKEVFLAISLNIVWILLALLAAWLGWRSYVLSANGNIAEGTVVELLEDQVAFDSDFNPVVEFEVDGQTYRVQSQNNYRWWNRYLRFPVGGQVEMRYDPANPERAEINSWWDIWNETFILGGFTVLSAIAVNAYLFLRWKSLRTRKASA